MDYEMTLNNFHTDGLGRKRCSKLRLKFLVWTARNRRRAGWRLGKIANNRTDNNSYLGYFKFEKRTCPSPSTCQYFGGGDETKYLNGTGERKTKNGIYRAPWRLLFPRGEVPLRSTHRGEAPHKLPTVKSKSSCGLLFTCSLWVLFTAELIFYTSQ